MHLHSFTYDFHLRTIHTYVASTSGPRVCSDYHLTKFLDDFTKYYPKTPNFARNVVCAGKNCIIKSAWADIFKPRLGPNPLF